MNPDLETIKNRLNIVDVIGQYLKLDKAGSNWRARCPFHNEKTPSFMVSEEKQIFHCFGCQKGGDVFTFVMEMEGLEFREALKLLADKAGVKLQKYEVNPQKEKQKNRTLEILDLATKFYEHCLLKSAGGEKVQKYLKDRGLKNETIKKFRLGYAPNSWRNIINFLIDRGYSESEIERTGLLVKKESGGFYDRFRARIVFPIADAQGRIVGFSARVAPGQDESQAKYINTPETEVYHKSKILFGLDKAKTSIKQNDWVLLVEGNMDVVAASQSGIENVVAVSGTALTSEQIRIIKRYTQNIKMFFDMDEAGEQATKKSLKLCFQEGLNPEIVSFSEGKDAADIVQENPELFSKIINESQEAFSYLLKRAFEKYDSSDPKNKKIIAQELIEMLAFMESDLEKDHWIRVLADKLNTKEGILTEMLKKANLKSSNYVSEDQKEEDKEDLEKTEILINGIIGLAFVYPQIWERVLSEQEIVNLLPIKIKEEFVKGASFDFDFDKFSNCLENLETKNELIKIFSEAKFQMSLSGEPEEKIIPDPLKELETHLKQLRIERKKQELDQITHDLKIAKEKGDKEVQIFLREESKKIAQELSDLI